MWAGKQLLLGQQACRMVQIERMTCAKKGKVVYSFWAPANDIFGEESPKF